MHCQFLKTEYLRNAITHYLQNVKLAAKLFFSQQKIKKEKPTNPYYHWVF